VKRDPVLDFLAAAAILIVSGAGVKHSAQKGHLAGRFFSVASNGGFLYSGRPFAPEKDPGNHQY